MEEILVLLIQFAIEVLIQFFVYLPFDVPLRGGKPNSNAGCGLAILYLALGGAIGGLSLLIAPHLMLQSTFLRVANLIVAPITAGLGSWGLSVWRFNRGAEVDPRTHFWTGFCFTLAFSAVRLAYAAR